MIRAFDSRIAAMHAAAERIAEALKTGISERGAAFAALSGGTTPTITTGTNTTASTVPVMLFQRVGNVVQFSGRASVSHTAGSPTASTFEISLPIDSALDAAADVIGTVTGDLVTKGYLTAELTNNTIVANYSIGGTGAQVVHFSGSYLVK